MNASSLDQIINAVLYEGYILYPYRPSSKKNQRERFTFGRVYPEDFSLSQNGAEPSLMQTECLAQARSDEAILEVSVRLLHVIRREIGVFPAPVSRWPVQPEPAFDLVPELRLGDRRYQAWEEAVEREIVAPAVKLRPSGLSFPFRFPASRALEPIPGEDGRPAGLIVRRQSELEGVVVVGVQPLEFPLFKITARIENHTPITHAAHADYSGILMKTFASTHTILKLRGGEFVSSLEPPPECRDAAAGCRNVGSWPVLVGDEAAKDRDTMLSSPIILYDYPRIAPESAGSFFDGTEIDEMLDLRIQTLTEEEKDEMRQAHAAARQLLERTQLLAEQDRSKLHGALREARSLEEQVWGSNTRLSGAPVGGVYVQKGHRVRVQPKGRADIFDLALKGQTAVVESVEEDAEHRVHFAVVFENDPGRDLGLLRQPGHRFFYGIDEIEPLGVAP